MAATGKRYLFTGGGTGGHVTPNLAILTEIRARSAGANFLYVGSARGYETRVQESGIAFQSVRCSSFCSPRRPLRFLRMGFLIVWGILTATWILLRFRPHVVVASGGYVSVPVVVAAWMLRRRVYVHEQNVHPGLANRLLALLATRVGVTFKETLHQFPKDKTVHAGYPVRRQIDKGSAASARSRLNIPGDRRVAFILGGSMGSRAINRGTVEALRTLLRDNDISVVHATGLSTSGEYRAFEDTAERLQRAGLGSTVPGRYVCKPFFDNIQDVYALADLVVARAGAGTIMELATVGKPSLLIPKSDVPGDHQLMNAMSLLKTGSAQVLFEERGEEDGLPITRVRGDALAQKISLLMSDEKNLARMGRKARQIAVRDALEIHVNLVTGLASRSPLVEKVTEIDRHGILLDEDGTAHDLLFRNNIVGTGFLADVHVRAPRRGRSARAVIIRSRRDGQSEFELIPRSGPVEIGGDTPEGRVTLRPEDVVTVAGRRFTFMLREREVERPVDTGGMSLKVIVTALGTLISRCFGFVRAATLGALFGLGNVLDLVAVGLGLSNYMRGVFAERAVDNTFLPTFIHLQRTGRTADANRLFSSFLTWTVIGSGAVSLTAILTMPAWLPWFLPGWTDPGLLASAVTLTSIMFPYLVLVSAAAVLSAVLKACNRFAVPAFSSIMFNVGLLSGVAMYPLFGVPAFGIGLLIGGAGQVLFHVPSVLSHDVRKGFGVRFRPRLGLKDPGIRKVGRVAPNVFADVIIGKAGSLVDIILATSLASGMVAALGYALMIFHMPFSLVAVSINTVVLKELSANQVTKDRESTRRLLADGINWNVFALLPVTATFLVLAEPMVSLLFGFGIFDAEAVGHVALALRCYAIGLVGWGLTGLCGRFFSGRMEQGRSTITSLVALVLNVVISISLVRAGLGIAGLALGTSAAFLLCAALRLTMLNRSLRAEGTSLRVKDIAPSLIQSTVATIGALGAMLVVHEAVRTFDGLPLVLNRLFTLAVPLAFGAFAFLATALLLRSEQVETVLLRLGRRRRSSDVEPSGEPRPVNPYCIPPTRLHQWVSRNPKLRNSYNFARRVTTFLKNPNWKVRNIGVKLIGELRLQSFRYDLADIVMCRKPAPLSHRIMGGDFEEPGFLRRNALVALERLGEVDPRTEKCLLMSLGDPYFEVRVEGARVLGAFAGRLPGATREEAVVLVSRLTRDKNFEVAAAAVNAVGELALDDGAVEVLRGLHYHRNWQVRDGVVTAYRRLYERRIVTQPRRILALLDDVLATSEGFIPRFVLKEHMTQLQIQLLKGEGDPGRAAPRPDATDGLAEREAEA